MIPPRDVVERLFRKIEQGVNKLGWDQPPHLAELLWNGSSILSARLMPIEIQSPPGGFLEHLGEVFQNEDQGRQTAQMMAADPRFFGLIFHTESWSNEQLTPEEYLRETRSLADIPGSVESRDLTAIDIAGRIYGLHRNRGEKPLYLTEDHAYAGRVIVGLQKMMIAIGEHLPAGDVDLGALRNLNLPDLEEVVARRARGEHPHTGEPLDKVES